jgi:HEPN domain-containing protein
MSAKEVSSLLASAQEFITESLRNLNGHRLRFAIVHAITATELVLKERLARLNPALARIPMRGYWDNRQARNEDAGVSSWT